MPAFSNLLTSVILSPFLIVFSALSLTSFQRATEYITTVAKSPQKGYMRTIKPYFKYVDTLLERLFDGHKFSISTTNILLMAIVILLLTTILENGEKPKKVMVVDKKRTVDKSD